MPKKTKARPARTESPTDDAPMDSRRFELEYVAGNNFRVIHVDGAWGGLRPDLTLHMNLYSERLALPTRGTLELDPATLTARQTLEATGRIVREFEVCALMDLPTAQALREWLDKKLEAAAARQAEVGFKAEGGEQ